MRLAIDPGSSSGAIAHVSKGQGLTVVNMPETQLDIWRTLQAMTHGSPVGTRILMENVGGTKPGNAARSARTFAEHVGGLKMALLALGVTHELVVPNKWMTELFGTNVPHGNSYEEKKARKQFIYGRMQSEYPGLHFTKDQADAVGILTYLCRRYPL